MSEEIFRELVETMSDAYDWRGWCIGSEWESSDLLIFGEHEVRYVGQTPRVADRIHLSEATIMVVVVRVEFFDRWITMMEATP
jgi:hypothetical protein